MTPSETSAATHGDAGTIVAIETAAVSLRANPKLAVRGARGSHDSSDFLLVKVATSRGVIGYGEVSATLRWSGEDATSANDAIKRVLGPAVIGQPLHPVTALALRMDLARPHPDRALRDWRRYLDDGGRTHPGRRRLALGSRSQRRCARLRSGGGCLVRPPLLAGAAQGGGGGADRFAHRGHRRLADLGRSVGDHVRRLLPLASYTATSTMTAE